MNDKKIALNILGLTYSQSQSGAYALVLNEINGKRRLPILIGGYEAQAISVGLDKIELSRPFFHDFVEKLLKELNATLEEILIYNLLEGVFYAKVSIKHQNNYIVLDAKVSDLIALAVRLNCPIYTYEPILSSAGLIINTDDEADFFDELLETETKNEFSKLSNEELDALLKESLSNEDYERAAVIRDEISRR